MSHYQTFSYVGCGATFPCLRRTAWAPAASSVASVGGPRAPTSFVEEWMGVAAFVASLAFGRASPEGGTSHVSTCGRGWGSDVGAPSPVPLQGYWEPDACL